MDSSYEIVRYQPDFKRQVIELQTHLWSPNLALNASYFEWKYEQNPYLKEPLIYLAMHQGKAIGMRGFSGMQMEGGVPAQQLIGLYADDMVIAPEHRNRGLMSKIMTVAFEDLAPKGYDFTFNLSAGAVTLHSSLSMGWRSAGWAHPMFWRSWRTTLQGGILRRMRRLPLISRQLEYFASRRPASRPRSLEDIDSERYNKILRTTSAISVKDTPQCAAMADLVARIGTAGKIRHVRSSEYFQWRFRNPLSRYRFLYWGGDRLEGYLVLQEYTSESANHEVVNIVDWEASNPAIQAGLLKAAFPLAKGRRLVIWSATLSQPALALLKSHGFRSAPRPQGPTPPSVLVRPIRGDMWNGELALASLPLLDLASWDLRMLFSMIG